jgi:hypothetical protein
VSGLTPDPGEGAFERTFALIAAVPPKVVFGIFHRYGKPLAVPMPPVAPDDQRALLSSPDGGEASVRVLQVRTPVDVIANDYFVLERGGQADHAALAVPGPLFSATLQALAGAAGVG